MLELDRILKQVQRRDRVNRLFHATGWCVAIALAAGCLLLLVDRATGAGLSWSIYAGVAGIGAALGIAGALATGPRLEELAVRMDRIGGLKDRAATAQAIAQGRLRNAELAGLVSADAERAVGGIDVKRIQPVRVGKVWLVVLLLGVGLGMGVRFMPPFDLFGGDSTSQAEVDEREEALAAEREEAREDVQNVAQEARELLGDGRGQDEAVAALERLSEQFSQRQLTQREMDEARDDAAARLDEVADKLADEARRQEALADELAARFTGLEEREPPMSAKEFAEALQRGDFGKAAEQMEKLRRDPQAMTPEERQAVADYLRSAGETISPQQAASDTSDVSQRELDRLEQALRDRGVDEETIQQIREEAANQEQTADRLKQEGVEEEQAERMAREAATAKGAEEAREQAEREARELSEALERAADQIERNENASQQQSDSNEDRGKPQDQRPSGQEDSAKQQDDAAQKQDGAKQPNEAQDGKEQQSGESKPQQQSGGEKPPGQQQGQKQEGAQEQKQDNAGSKQQPGQQQSGQQQQQGQQQQPAQQQQGGSQEGKQEGKQEGQPQGQESGGEEGGKQEGGERPGGSKSDGGAGADSPMDTPGDPGASKEKSKQGGAQGGGEGEQPGDAPAQQQKPDGGGGAGEPRDDQRQGSQPGAKEGESGDEKQGGGGAGEAPQQPANAEDVLRRMEQAREAAKRQQEASERAREAARKLADRASERQQGDTGNWADSRSRERGGSGSSGAGEGEGSKLTDERGGTFRPDATEGMELGGEEPGSKILAEWLDESRPATPGEARSSTFSGHVERAKRSAEQAVEQTAVPARYHELIRRYFGKGLPAAAERASGGGNEAKPEGAAP